MFHLLRWCAGVAIVQIASLLCSPSLVAQAGDVLESPELIAPMNGGFRFYVGGGVIAADQDDLNLRLGRLGYPRIRVSFPGSGYFAAGGSYVIPGTGLIAGVELGGYAARGGDSSGTTGLSSLAGVLDIGYVLHDEGGLALHSSIGVGGGVMNLELDRSYVIVAPDPSGNPAVISGDRSISTPALTFGGSIGIDYTLPQGSDSGLVVPSGLMLGLRVGGSIAMGWWEIDRESFTAIMPGYHALFTIGMRFGERAYAVPMPE